ncbi:DUF2190 domain-containing protein [Morganella morganii]|uniref:DUF2190 domain-containing protein n=1 Tax=Morganella morganii TaxID=582 RepID=A0A8I0PUR1_MORMO|nr:DUF2190 family protein [Morganella morganii]MBE8611522.1 DUF2190 domain-containing protein [Morganella morganii]
MATQQVILTTTILAAAAVTQQRLVGYNRQPCTEGAAAFGVAEVDGAAGDAVPLNVMGILSVEAGGTIEVGSKLQSDANGCVIPLKTTGTPVQVGVAITAAAAAGNTLRVMWGA